MDGEGILWMLRYQRSLGFLPRSIRSRQWTKVVLNDCATRTDYALASAPKHLHLRTCIYALASTHLCCGTTALHYCTAPVRRHPHVVRAVERRECSAVEEN